MEYSMFRSAYQGQREYFIEFYLRGIAETFVYPVTQENHERLRAVLPEKEMESVPPEFWGFETTDNRTVVISVHDIQLARLLWEPGQSDEHERNDTDEYSDKLSIYLRGRKEPYRCSTSSARQAFELLIDVDTAPEADSRFLSFVDEDGEEIFFNSSDVVVFEVPKEFVKEGQAEDEE